MTFIHGCTYCTKDVHQGSCTLLGTVCHHDYTTCSDTLLRVPYTNLPYHALLTINSGTKVPTWSLHSWLTVAHVEISTTGSI